MTIRVLIADDQDLVRVGFRMILEAEDDIDVVGEASDGEQALTTSRRLDPDVVLMDIRMPGLDGIQATRRLMSAGSATSVLVLTTFDIDEYVYGSLRAGASGFLLKNCSPEQLVAAVRVVARGDALLDPAITRRVIERFVDLSATQAARSTLLQDLSPREVDVLRLLALGLTNAEIAEKLVVSPTTVKSHVAHILAKLGARDRLQAVITAYETGLVVPGMTVPKRAG